MGNTDTKKSLSEQRAEMMKEYDKEHSAFRKLLGLSEKMQDEECMIELLVDAGEVTWEDMDVATVFCKMKECKSLKKALDKSTKYKNEYRPKITADQFKKNIVRVMNFKSWEDFEAQWGEYLDI